MLYPYKMGFSKAFIYQSNGYFTIFKNTFLIE